MEAKLLHHVPSIPIIPVEIGDLELALGNLSEPQRNWAREMGFAGTLGQVTMLPDCDGAIDRVLFGIGEENARSRERLIFGKLATSLRDGNYNLQDHPAVDNELAALSWLLGQYSFDDFKSSTQSQPKLVIPEGVDKARVEGMASASHNAMTMINRPANQMTVSALVDQVRLIARRYSAKFNLVVGDDLLKQNFPLIHTVGRAGSEPPALAELEWGDEGKPLVTVIGKGVVFDTGGLNIKPGSSMALMKKDMGGAANAIALAEMIMMFDLPIRLRLLVPIAENSIAGNAFRPGDILRARDGKTVEINNTDAEGRLILADAIAYAAERKPDHIMTFATLTGAARVALGPDLPPMYSTDDDFADITMRLSMAQQDPVWRMPFWDPYEAMIENPNAELDNAPSGGFAGSITAALFLRRFADGQKYSHFDIYGWTPKALPGRPYGGAAQAIRAALASLEEIYGRQN